MGKNNGGFGSGSGGGTVVAVFGNPVEAERAVDDLRSNGVAADSISVAVRDDVPTRGVGIDAGSNAAAAAAIGALFGAIIGGVSAWMFSLSDIAVSGQGPTSGIGGLAATLVGAGLGAAVGGLLGGILGLRVPSETPQERAARAGRATVLITVQTPMYSDQTPVEALLSASGGQEVYAYTDVPTEEDNLMDHDISPVEPDYEAAPLPSRRPASSESNIPLSAFNSELPTGTAASLARANDDQPPTDPALSTVAADTEEEAIAGARADIDESTGEPNWYEAMPSLPVGAAPHISSEESGRLEDAETWADIAAMAANKDSKDMEDTPLNENQQGTNANNVTGTQGAIDPETGVYGTGGTPMTTGYGVSGSTIGVGTTGGQQDAESDDFRGSTPGSSSYDMGGRASTDSQKSLEGAERDTSVVDKYAGQNIDAAPPQLPQDPRTRDIYEKGPSYGGDAQAQPDVDRSDLSSTADVGTPPSYANTSTDESHASAGTNIPGTADPRGIGDNTDDVD